MDPIFTQFGKTAIQQTVTSTGSPSQGTGSNAFQQMLDLQTNQSDDSTSRLMSFVDQTFGADKAGGINAVDASSVHVEISKATEVSRTPGTSHMLEVLQEVNKDQMQFENIKEMVSSGRTFKPQELLAMQVGVQHLSLELELFSKALEQVNRTIQTPINMQIG